MTDSHAWRCFCHMRHLCTLQQAKVTVFMKSVFEIYNNITNINESLDLFPECDDNFCLVMEIDSGSKQLQCLIDVLHSLGKTSITYNNEKLGELPQIAQPPSTNEGEPNFWPHDSEKTR